MRPKSTLDQEPIIISHKVLESGVISRTYSMPSARYQMRVVLGPGGCFGRTKNEASLCLRGETGTSILLYNETWPEFLKAFIQVTDTFTKEEFSRGGKHFHKISNRITRKILIFHPLIWERCYQDLKKLRLNDFQSSQRFLQNLAHAEDARSNPSTTPLSQLLLAPRASMGLESWQGMPA
jgi:hypothetical protein